MDSNEKPKPRLTKLPSEKLPDKLDFTPAAPAPGSAIGAKFQHYVVGHHMIRKEYGKRIQN